MNDIPDWKACAACHAPVRMRLAASKGRVDVWVDQYEGVICAARYGGHHPFVAVVGPR